VLHDRRGSLDQVLAVVEDEQHLARRQGGVEHRERLTRPRLRDPEDTRDHGRQEVAVGHRRQLDEPRAVRKAAAEHGGEPQREPGLADARGPEQRDQSRAMHEPRQLAQLALAAHERSQLRRQVAPPAVRQPT